MSWPGSLNSAAEPLWAIVGATGTGKTRLAIELAERVGGEIVSVDSAQIFRGLDIGTAKPSPAERARVRHHVIDVVDPEAQWSSAAFAEAATTAIEDIQGRGLRPILCGGTGLWLRALTRGLFEVPPIDPATKDQVRRRLEEEGAPAVHRALSLVDPEAARRLHPNDTQRIGRALEVYLGTGQTISSLQDAHGFRAQRFRWRGVALDWPRQALVEHLDRRVRAMFAAGLIAEVRGLLERGVPRAAPGFFAIGYRESLAHLLDGVDERTTIEETVIATRQYAKRQRNWFKSDAEVEWVAPTITAAELEEIFRRASGGI
ncbi:MAG: tRNA (adenosine(37)-N6)-dimethylallyltransferase MiaA [Myxococcota bacterium]